MPTKAAIIPDVNSYDYGIEDIPEVSGPTAETVGEDLNKYQPKSMQEYGAMGIGGNTALDVMRKIKQDAVMSARKKAFEALIEQGEKGADLFIQDAIKTDGEDVVKWLPPKEGFYQIDPNAGIRYFDSVNWQSHAYTGLMEYRKMKMKQESESARQAEMTKREQMRDVREKAKMDVEQKKMALYSQNMTNDMLHEYDLDIARNKAALTTEMNQYKQSMIDASIMDETKGKYDPKTDPKIVEYENAQLEWDDLQRRVNDQRSALLKKKKSGAAGRPAPTINPPASVPSKKSDFDMLWEKGGGK